MYARHFVQNEVHVYVDPDTYLIGKTGGVIDTVEHATS